MKRFILVNFIVCISILFAGCGNEGTADQILDAIKNKDYVNAKQIYHEAINKTDDKDQFNKDVSQPIIDYIDQYYSERVSDGDTEATFQSLLKNIEDVGIYDSSLNDEIQLYEEELKGNDDPVSDNVDDQSSVDPNSSITTTVNDSSEEANNEQETTTPVSTTVTSSLLDVNHGQYASITIKTNPGATGTIEVDYNSGPSTAAGLYPQTADGNGMITWTWKVGTRTAPGVYPVIITVDGSTITDSLTVH